MSINERKMDSNIIAKIIYNINNEEKEYSFIIKSDNNKSIIKDIKLFLELKHIAIKPNSNFYLKRDNIIIRELDKNEIINKTDIRTNDQIIILENKKIFSNKCSISREKVSDSKMSFGESKDEIFYEEKKS